MYQCLKELRGRLLDIGLVRVRTVTEFPRVLVFRLANFKLTTAPCFFRSVDFNSELLFVSGNCGGPCLCLFGVVSNASVAWVGHGADGLGGLGEIERELVKPQEEHAVNALIRLAEEHPDLHIACLGLYLISHVFIFLSLLIYPGPLTNVALAICMSEKFKSFAEKIEKGRFVVMGGCHTSKGNSGLASEFNMHVSLEKAELTRSRHTDPEAANICFDFFGNLTLVSFELTVKASLKWEWYDEVIKNGTGKVVQFLAKITEILEGTIID